MKHKDEKFWSKVEQSKSKTACWPWRGAKDRDGYGRVMRVQFEKPEKAHRYAFFLHHGRWPEGKCLHSCGNKGCVRPSHLYDHAKLATRKPVMLDGSVEDLVVQVQKQYVKGSRINGVHGLAKRYGIPPGLMKQFVDGSYIQKLYGI